MPCGTFGDALRASMLLSSSTVQFLSGFWGHYLDALKSPSQGSQFSVAQLGVRDPDSGSSEVYCLFVGFHLVFNFNSRNTSCVC